MPDKQRLLFNSTDITELKKIQIKLEHTVDIMDKNIISSTTDLNGVIIDISTAFCKVSGYSKEELIGKKHNILKHPEMTKEIFTDLWKKIKKDGIWNGEIRNMRKDGSSYWAETTIISDYDELTKEKIGYTAIRHDITSKKIIEEIAIRDELTSLYNRRYFNTIITDEINRAKRDKKVLSFAMMDVDHFKKYNDTYGHQEGDAVLSKIGEVLNSFTKRAGDFAFRLGGEEFAILFSGVNSDQALLFINSIKKAIEDLKILHIKNTASPVVTISAGLISIMPDEQMSENEIYKRADELLYKAKENGRNIVVV
jgi:diguanylate cyclase (GGDEF)-like protein/PAS domain S-box-containing protein